MKLTLDQIPINGKARIIKIEENAAQIKLMELGCVPSTIVTMKRKAPLGGPIAIEVAGYLLSMRVSEAENILVELCEE